VSREKAPPEYTRMRVVPTKLVDEAFSGGGGDPNVKPSDEQQKGNPDAKPDPQPPREIATPTPQAPPEPRPEKPTPPPQRPEPNKDTTPPTPKKLPEPKPIDKSRYEDILKELKPAKLSDQSKAREKAAADARARAQREWNDANQKIAKQIGRAVEGLARGFEQGTVVQAHGPGGEAYANYADFVRQKYEDAWVVSDMMSDDESTVRVIVTIHRSGRVVNARITGRSGDPALDRTVQKALDKVNFIAPFPEGSRDEQRNFNINFNLKTKRLLG
jgi:protein TonB